MTKHVQELLTELGQSNPLLKASAAGASPAAIKFAIIEKLSPYFRRHEILERCAIDALAPEFLRVARIEADPWSHAILLAALRVYEDSEAVGTSDCFRAFEQWWSDVNAGFAGFWSLYNLRQKDVGTSPHDITFERFRNVGSLLEGAAQPVLRELLAHSRIARGKEWTSDKLRGLDFGNVVEELKSTPGMAQVCEPDPWKVRLSQWRNVAQHQSYKTTDNGVVVRYGKHPKTVELSMTFAETELLWSRVSSLFTALGSARAIFTIDNHESISVNVSANDSRTEGRLLHLTTGFSSQGFELVSVSENNDELEAIIRDTTDADTVKRGAHVMQFVHPLWSFFRKSQIKIRFLNRDSAEQFLFTAAGENIRAYQEGRLPEAEMAKSTKVEYLSALGK